MDYVEYPVYLDDIVVVGYLNTHSRSILVRPKGRGHFVFVAWPQPFPDSAFIIRKELFYPSPNSAPQQFVIDVKERARSGLTSWEWALAKRESREQELANSDVIFSEADIPRGSISFDLQSHSPEIRTIAWSCHQPFETEGGRSVQHKYVDEIMEWYWKVTKDFDPHVIWGAGDTAYSDGADATNFVKHVYSKPTWHLDQKNQEWLRASFRYMYRYHWSFKRLQQVMRNYPHILMWDDHEIHDGWGSDNKDFSEENLAMFRIAKEVADEYVLKVGQRLRDDGDSHKAYIVGHQAHFITDTRTSRKYHFFDTAFSNETIGASVLSGGATFLLGASVGQALLSGTGPILGGAASDVLEGQAFGTVMSDRQFNDLAGFCDIVAANPRVHFLILNTTVPLVHANDLLTLIATAGITGPLVDPLVLKDDRDDVRDSWMANGNRPQLVRLLWILRTLQLKRPDIEIVVVSGDVHVAGAFTIYLAGTMRPIYQITSSAITNRQHPPPWKRETIGLSTFNIPLLPGEVAVVNRIWPEITDPNFLCIKSTPDNIELELQVLPVDNSTNENLKLSIPYSLLSVDPLKLAEVTVGPIVSTIDTAGRIVDAIF